MKTDFYAVVVLILLRSSLQSFQPQRKWCIKILLPRVHLMLGRVSKCPWQVFPSSDGGVYNPVSETSRLGSNFSHRLIATLQGAESKMKEQMRHIGNK